MTAYRKRLAKFPVRLPRGPQDKLTTLFEKLRLDVMAPPTRAQARNQWISAPTWALINIRAALRQQGKLSQHATHLIGRQIAAGLKGDRAKCAAAAVKKIEGHLAAGEPKKAWRSLRGWYQDVTDCAPKASKMSLAAQTAKRITLYGSLASKGDPIPIHVDKANILEDIPRDGELRAVVRELQNRRAAGATGLQAKHIKVWLTDIARKEEEQSNIGLGHKWRVFVKLMQAVWEHGSIPEQMRWEIVVLLPKGGGDYRGIGLLEPFWKVVEKIMVAQLALIKFHDGLHGRLPGGERGQPRLRQSSLRAWPGAINACSIKSTSI